MSPLSRHLEQISLSAESIATLPFPPPKMFTNALLTTHDITSLIRDTEPHERALFSVPAAPSSHSAAPVQNHASARRQTVFAVSSGEVTTGVGPTTRAPRRNTAVAAVLGPELHSQVRKSEATQQGRQGEVDVQVLLRGAEKLNEVYAIRGVPERIAGLRSSHARLKGSVEKYEEKVERLTRELERMNKGDGWRSEGDGEDDNEEDAEDTEGDRLEDILVMDEDLKKEEEEIKELERKKKELEDRVSGMERDLGGLLR